VERPPFFFPGFALFFTNSRPNARLTTQTLSLPFLRGSENPAGPRRNERPSYVWRMGCARLFSFGSGLVGRAVFPMVNIIYALPIVLYHARVFFFPFRRLLFVRSSLPGRGTCFHFFRPLLCLPLTLWEGQSGFDLSAPSECSRQLSCSFFSREDFFRWTGVSIPTALGTFRPLLS